MSTETPIKTEASRMIWLPAGLGGLGLIAALFFGTAGFIVGVPLLLAGGALGYRLYQRHERERFEHRALSVYRGIAAGEVTREDLVRHMHYTPADAEKVLSWLVGQNLMTVDYSATDEGMIYRLKVSGSGAPALPPAVSEGRQSSAAFDAQLEAAGATATGQRELQALKAAAEARLKARRDREAAEELARQREAEEAARLAEEERRKAEEERRKAAEVARQAFDERLKATRKPAEQPKPAPKPAAPKPAAPKPAAPKPDLSDFDRAFFKDDKGGDAGGGTDADDFDKRFKKR